MSGWLRALEEGWWPDDPVDLTSARRRRYETLYEIAGRVGPDRIVEIGVRAGYSAYAMLSAAPDARYLGIDDGSGDHGGAPGALDHARGLLGRFAGAGIIVCDSREVRRLPAGVDLLHVDGDHSYEGAASDLRLGLRSGVGTMVVDDVLYIEDVRLAVGAFARKEGLSVKWINDGHHGIALIDCRG